MNRLTRTRRVLSSAGTGASRAASRARSQPWSEVKAPVSSGTRGHCAGRTSRTNSSNPWKGLPSMLNSAPGFSRTTAASSRTSPARTWRPSGRGCTVMPCAPAASAMRAAWTTSGIPTVRVLRRSATLLRLALSEVITRPSQGQQVPEDPAALQRLVLPATVEQHAHQRLGLLLGERVGIVVARHVEERAARDDSVAAGAVCLDRSALRVVAVALRRIDRATADALVLEGHRVAQLLQ